MKSILLTLFLCLFVSLAFCRKKPKIKISPTIYLSHNSVFKKPAPLLNFIPCIDCGAFQRFPTMNMGGGVVFDKIYRSNIVLRTGLLYSTYDFYEEQSKENASRYLPRFPHIAIIFQSTYNTFQIPIQIAYRYKSFTLYAGGAIEVFYFHRSESVDYYERSTISHKSSLSYFPISHVALKYEIPKIKLSVIGGVDLGYYSERFYRLGFEFPIYLRE